MFQIDQMNDFKAYLKYEKLKAKQSAQLANKTVPYKRPPKDRTTELESFKSGNYNQIHEIIANNNDNNETSDFSSEQTKTKNNAFKFCTISLEQNFSTKDLTDIKSERMKPITLSEMQVNKIHENYYLKCRTIIDAKYDTGMSFLIEDDNDENETVSGTTGDVEYVSLYNFSLSRDIPASSILPSGTLILIKEPFLRLSAKTIGYYFIQIDSPSDLIIVNEDLQKDLFLSKNVVELNQNLQEHFNKLVIEGDYHFNRKEYEASIRVYSKILKYYKSCHSFNDREEANFYSSIFFKRASAHLELNQFYPAFKDSQISATIEKDNERSFYILGKSNYGMRKWQSALDAFQQSLEISNEKIKKKQAEINHLNEWIRFIQLEIDRTSERLNEQETGDYDLIDLFDKSEAGVLRFDLADYRVNDVAFVEIEGKDKGIMALNDIKKGTLLVASKAAAISYSSECTDNNNVLTYNMFTNLVEPQSQNQKRINLIYAMRFNPYLADQVCFIILLF
jgi:tetratricopeptide (TPR) repeat protein